MYGKQTNTTFKPYRMSPTLKSDSSQEHGFETSDTNVGGDTNIIGNASLVGGMVSGNSNSGDNPSNLSEMGGSAGVRISQNPIVVPKCEISSDDPYSFVDDDVMSPHLLSPGGGSNASSVGVSGVIGNVDSPAGLMSVGLQSQLRPTYSTMTSINANNCPKLPQMHSGLHHAMSVHSPLMMDHSSSANDMIAPKKRGRKKKVREDNRYFLIDFYL